MKQRMRPLLSKHSISCLTTAVVATFAVLYIVSSVGAQQFNLTNEQFDQWVYSGNRNNLSSDSEITLAVEAVDRVCHLTQAQQDKLHLAGRGDFARFQLRVDELRAQYAGKNYDQNDIGKIYEKIQPLTTTYQTGMLGSSSLFSKVLHGTLTPAQREEYEGVEGERLKQRYAAKVRLLVAIYGQSCPLKDERSALIDLLTTETKPPKRTSQYDWYVVLAQASNIPDEKFAAILDAAQMRWLKKSLAQGRGMAGFLKQQDIMPDP
jgi:hypothetical protein